MTKLKTFFRRLFAGSFKRMFGYIGTIHKETGKNRFIMFFDMIWCIFRYSVGYMDYRVFGFANIKGKNRRTFMTMNDNITISKRCNDRTYFHIFDNKSEFDEAFREYIGRDFLNLEKATADDLREFCKGRETVFAKPVKQAPAAVYPDNALTRPDYLCAAFVQEIRQILYLRLSCGVCYHRLALCGEGGEHYILRRADAREREAYAARGQPVRGGAFHAAAALLDDNAHAAECGNMHIYRAQPYLAPAGESCAPSAESCEQGTEKDDGRAHLAHQLLGYG